MPSIDSHQHYWKLSRGDYRWMTPDLKPLFKNFLPSDLKPLLEKHGIEGTVVVQAADTVEETEYLLSLAKEEPTIFGVVGWIAMASPDAVVVLERLVKNPKFVGIRPMLQDLDEDDWMLRPELDPVFCSLIAHDLTFDALVFPRHLPYLRELCTRYPALRVVVDHGAKPDIKTRAFGSWAKEIASLAQTTTAFCKMSGLLTEAEKGCALSVLKPYLDHLFDSFGPERILWGSDWPVLNLASDYEHWYRLSEEYIQTHYPQYLHAIFGDNARQFYQRIHLCHHFVL